MIVVIGSLFARLDGADVRAGGVAASVAIAAAGQGRAVQLVGRIGDDRAADAVLGDLTRQGVGHVAVLRDAAHPTPFLTDGPETGVANRLDLDPEDVELALRYLTDFSVVAIVGAAGPVRSVVERAASWAAAAFVVIDETPIEGETMDGFVARVGAELARLDAAGEPVRSAR